MKTTRLLLATVLAASACMLGCDAIKTNNHQFFYAGDVIVSPDGTNPVISIRQSMGPLDQYEEIAPHATFPTPADLQYDESDYLIGPGDVMNVLILDLYNTGGETVVQKTVSESGYIDLPLLEKQIKAGGLSRTQLRDKIIEAYDAKGILRKANASVQVEMVVKRKAIFSILGAAVRPGAYSVSRPDMRLLEALAIGGGVSQSNIDYIYVIRHGGAQPTNGNGAKPANGGQGSQEQKDGFDDLRKSLQSPSVVRYADNPEDPTAETDPAELKGKGWKKLDQPGWTRSDQGQAEPDNQDEMPETAQGQDDDDDDLFDFAQSLGPAAQSRVIAINLEKLRRGDPMMNIVIRDSDVIQIIPLEVGLFYVAGHVNRPGPYDLTGRKITVKQAITTAGMFDQVAWPENTVLIRRVGQNQEQYIKLDLEKIWAGTEEDVFVRKDDVIAVGTNWSASFMAVIRNSFRMTYGFGFIYDRNFADALDRANYGYDSSRFTRW